jgi:hypothetical protein
MLSLRTTSTVPEGPGGPSPHLPLLSHTPVSPWLPISCVWLPWAVRVCVWEREVPLDSRFPWAASEGECEGERARGCPFPGIQCPSLLADLDGVGKEKDSASSGPSPFTSLGAAGSYATSPADRLAGLLARDKQAESEDKEAEWRGEREEGQPHGADTWELLAPRDPAGEREPR